MPKTTEPYMKESIPSEEHNELRFTRDNYGTASAFLTYPLTGEEKLVGRVDLVTGQCKVNDINYTLSGAPDEIFHKFQVKLNWYVDYEKENGYMFPISIEPSDKIEGLRYIMWDDGSGRAEYNGEKVGSIDLMTGEMEVGSSGYIPAPYDDRIKTVEAYKSAIEDYVSDYYKLKGAIMKDLVFEKENDSISAYYKNELIGGASTLTGLYRIGIYDTVAFDGIFDDTAQGSIEQSFKNLAKKYIEEDFPTIHSIAADIEQFMFERGEYEYPEYQRLKFVALVMNNIQSTNYPSDEDRDNATKNIEKAIASSPLIGKQGAIDYIKSEVFTMDADDESLEIGKYCLKLLENGDLDMLYTPYGTFPEMDSLVNSDDWVARSEAVKRGYALDRLASDENDKVRAAVCNTGYKPEAFFNDENEFIREKAMEMYIRNNEGKTIVLDNDRNIYPNTSMKITISVQSEDENENIKEVNVKVLNFENTIIAEGKDIPVDDLADFIKDVKETEGDCHKLQKVKYVDDYGDNRYEIEAYFGSDFKGLNDSIGTDDWSKVEEFAHEKAMSGLFVEITNSETGKSVRIDPDKYQAEFDGEFPYKSDYLDNDQYNAFATEKNSGRLSAYIYTNNWDDIKQFSEKCLKDNCNVEIIDNSRLFSDENGENLTSITIRPIDYEKNGFNVTPADFLEKYALNAYTYSHNEDNNTLSVFEGNKLLADISDVDNSSAEEMFKEFIFEARGIDLDSFKNKKELKAEPKKEKTSVERD